MNTTQQQISRHAAELRESPEPWIDVAVALYKARQIVEGMAEDRPGCATLQSCVAQLNAAMADVGQEIANARATARDDAADAYGDFRRDQEKGE